MTAREIRERILSVTTENGGHLASSLGAVEIAMALAEVFDPYRDRIVWDVGHQAYAWKILTGRDDAFGSLRRFGGLSGFPNPLESKADAAIAGHAGVAISVAEGFAAARDLAGRDEQVVAVVGDAALVNGTSFEALNACEQTAAKVIVVLNDNDMAISRPVGGGSRDRGHRFGERFFEPFGLRFIGPVDGHDLSALKAALVAARAEPHSVVVHAVTTKGRGYAPAEDDPTRWHGVAPAPRDGAVPKAGRTWSACMGDALCAAARADRRIVALTAGMKDGTGLNGFAEAFPGRFFDVGIAEGHMVSFAAGLAGGGMRPVVAVYSTFLQRAVDQVMHDVCIANLPVVFCVDRAGVVGADGVTHQGVFDLAMLKSLPNLTICQPKDEADLRALLDEALRRNGPTVIRYPRGTVPATLPDAPRPEGADTVIWTTGDWYGKACEVARRIGAEVVHARYLKPVDSALAACQAAAGRRVVSLENGSVIGGLGESVGASVRFGWPDTFIPHGTVAELERAYGLDVDSIVRRLTT